jgi:hypothetical protein
MARQEDGFFFAKGAASISLASRCRLVVNGRNQIRDAGEGVWRTSC